MAVAPDTGSADLGAAGFSDADCGAVDKAAYREKICHPEKIGNHGVQRQLEAQFGVTFAQLCSAAQAEAGLPQQLPGTTGVFSPNRRAPTPTRGPSLLGSMGAANQNSAAGGK